MTNLQKIMMLICISAALLPFAAAFGVTSSYWDTNPLQLHPGEERTIDLELQNMVGGTDIKVLAKVTEGAEIATLLGETDTFLVPFGRKDIVAKVLFKVPADALPGETKQVMVSFTQVADESKGEMIQMVSGVGKKIPVAVVSDQQQENQGKLFGGKGPLSLSWILAVALIAFIIALLYFVVRKRI